MKKLALLTNAIDAIALPSPGLRMTFRAVIIATGLSGRANRLSMERFARNDTTIVP
jgi:hypothetical protein